MGTMKASLGTLVALATLAERARPGLAGSNFAGDEVGTLFGFLGAASALIFSCAPHPTPFRALSLAGGASLVLSQRKFGGFASVD